MIQNSSDEMWMESTMEMSESTTKTVPSDFKKKSSKKYRRPPRRAKDDVLLAIPEFVAVQQDLGIKRKPSESVNMDVTAGSMEVVDMPEIAMSPNSHHPQHDSPPINNFPRDIFRNADQICISRSIIATILFICIFFVLTCITIITILIWRSTTWTTKGKGSITTTPPTTPSSTISGSILAYNNNVSTVA
uniref:Uncharacterized protein n=1 Tax=Panagrolaimus sp. JU765 TaxID=591449 RepID=A0AC34RK12_9BILA